MKLFDPFSLGSLELSSRITMAPLTRRRATRTHVPVPMMETYYAQRAGAGLIIAEGTAPSPNGAGYSHMPGLYNSEQLEAWKKITEKVHANGGKIVLQVMHTGRIGHANNVDPDAEIVAPSAIQYQGETSTYDLGKQPYTVPKEMSVSDIEQTVNEFANCAHMAIEAGFDGIEIHGAHGYLPNQFLNQSSNIRADKYGGNHANRMRFLLEVIDACACEIGPEKVGLRISPFSYADKDEDPLDLVPLYLQLAEALNSRNLSYLHLSHMGDPEPVKFELWTKIREKFHGNLMLCGDFTRDSAEEALQTGRADLIAFGRDFITNPDLVERLKNNWPLAERDRTFWYTQGAQGLIDYPTYNP